MLTLLGSVTLLTGTLMYQKFFKEWEVRTMMMLNIIIGFFAIGINLLFVLRVNVYFGINDLVFIVFTNIITDTLNLAFSQMPTLVLFAMITPKNIEATVFALFTGVFNLSASVLSPFVGVLINGWFFGIGT